MDILRALDAGDLTMLTLLDLSAAFDTVDHATLLRRLEISYGIRSISLGWFSSYLGSRFQYVRCGLSKSTLRLVLCGVPQGSVLGPILFLLYSADIIRLIESHCLNPHVYADDTQPKTTSDSTGFCTNWRWRGFTSHFRQGPWNTSWRWRYHELSCRQDSVKLLLCVTPALKYPSVCHQTSSAVACRVVGPCALGLRQRITRRSAQHSS